MALKQHAGIRFSYHEVSFRLKGVVATKLAVAALMTKEQHRFTDIRYIFCSDRFLLQLNQQFLSHDTYTDILTFTLSLPGEPIASEIYISVERVQENADGLGVPFMEELQRVMIHGLLHLCGYEDDTAAKKAQMRIKEEHYMKLLF